ncbi:MAG: hypothetical protein ACE5Q6_03225 [Dehalococcoidia bacterium]
MNQQTPNMEISDVRRVVARIVNDQPVPEKVARATRQNFCALVQSAITHGLTEADVVRSLLQPVFDKSRGCDCPTCRWRREELGEAMVQRMSLTV